MKDPGKKMKRQATEWGELFTNHTPDKRLVSRIYNTLSKLSSEKAKRDQKMAKHIHRHRIHMVGKEASEKMFTALTIREMQNSTT